MHDLALRRQHRVELVRLAVANHALGGRNREIGQLVGGSAGALGIVGVASRADEIGAGRIDAMLSATDVAGRFTAEMNKTGICQAVVPVSGLLALTARTLRQSEFTALQKLAGSDPAAEAAETDVKLAAVLDAVVPGASVQLR